MIGERDVMFVFFPTWWFSSKSIGSKYEVQKIINLITILLPTGIIFNLICYQYDYSPSECNFQLPTLLPLLSICIITVHLNAIVNFLLQIMKIPFELFSNFKSKTIDLLTQLRSRTKKHWLTYKKYMHNVCWLNLSKC